MPTIRPRGRGITAQARHERELIADRRRAIALLVFPVVAGIVDVASYIGLHEVFTANMTGNSALLAIAVAKGSLGGSARAGAALLGYCLGVAVGALTRVPEREREWLARVAVPVGIEAAVLVGLTLGWLAAGASPGGWTVYPLIGAAAIAMGLQGAANRPSALRAVSSTYMTGTITRGVEAAVARLRPEVGEPDEDPQVRAGIWVLYFGGAVAGGVAVLALHAWSAAIAAALMLLVAAVAWLERASGL